MSWVHLCSGRSSQCWACLGYFSWNDWLGWTLVVLRLAQGQSPGHFISPGVSRFSLCVLGSRQTNHMHAGKLESCALHKIFQPERLTLICYNDSLVWLEALSQAVSAPVWNHFMGAVVESTLIRLETSWKTTTKPAVQLLEGWYEHITMWPCRWLLLGKLVNYGILSQGSVLCDIKLTSLHLPAGRTCFNL